MTEPCPNCGKEMQEYDCGPDSYDDDITYTSDYCFDCELWCDGWFDKWGLGTYPDSEDLKENWKELKRE